MSNRDAHRAVAIHAQSRFLVSEQICCVSSRRFLPHSAPQRSPHSRADVRCSTSCTVCSSAPFDSLCTVEYFSVFKAVLDVFGLCVYHKKKESFLSQHKQMIHYATTDVNYKKLCESVRVGFWVHIWAFSVFGLWVRMDRACFCLDW